MTRNVTTIVASSILLKRPRDQPLFCRHHTLRRTATRHVRLTLRHANTTRPRAPVAIRHPSREDIR